MTIDGDTFGGDHPLGGARSSRADEPVDYEKQIGRLERRVERERIKRVEAERIAEEGTRRLYDINVELDEVLQERTSDYESARRALVAAESWKAEFLDSLSHEVRTPLNGIFGMMELLSSVVEDETHKLWFDTAVASAERLDRMFGRLLRAIELESLDLTALLADVPVSGIIDVCIAKWMPLAMRSGHLLVPSVQQTPGLVAATIPERVLEVLDELLSNATVHGKPGPVHLEVTQIHEAVEIAVVDQGPGIDTEKGELLVQPIFQRTPEAWAADGSMGLGLGLARRTADALGAQLRLCPHGGGSRAVLTLPVPVHPTT